MSYIVGHPIKRPSDFYGRFTETVRFFEIIGGTQAQSVSILGLRRAGKTSFLQYVSHPDIAAQYLPDPENTLMIYLDMSYCKTPSDFYYRLLIRLQQELGNQYVTRSLWKPSPPGEATIYDVEVHLCQLNHSRIVLLLDEFDHLRTGKFDQDFLIELRAMTGVLDYDLACVTASYWDLFQLGEHLGLPPTSPFYNIFYPTPIYLAGLDTADFIALTRQALQPDSETFSDIELSAINQIAGTLPFFVQATADLWTRQRRKQGAVDPIAIRDKLVSEMKPFFSQWWRHFSDCERDVLRQAANIPTAASQPCHQVQINEATRKLINFGLLIANTNHPIINGDLFCHWLHLQQATPAHPKPASAPRSNQRAEIRRILSHSFNHEELRTLCFDLGLSYDDLPGQGVQAKARDLVDYCEKRSQTDRLIEAIRYERGMVI